MSNYYDQPHESQWVSSFVPLDLGMIAKTGEMKQEEQDKANAERMDFYGKQVQALKKDVPLVTQEKQKIDSELNDKWGNVDFNDPTVRHEWAQRKRELANEYGPQGKLGIVQQNYLAAQAYQKELDDKLDKKEIDQVQHDKLLAMSHDSYKGAENGSFNGITAAYNPDINKQATELTANWKANGTDNGYTWENGQWVKHTTKGTEYISDNEVYNHLMNTLMEDPANKAYAQQQANIAMYGQNYSTESGGHLGVDGGGNTVEFAPGYEQDAKQSIHNKIYYDMFDKSAKLAAARTGFVKTKNDETWDQNQAWLKDYSDKKDKENSYKYQQTGEGATVSGLINDPKYADYININSNGEKEINYKGLLEAASSGKNPGWWTDFGRNIAQGFITIGSLGLNNNNYIKQKQLEEGMTALEFKNKLQSIMENKAELSGYDKKVTPENYNEILNKASQFEQLRGLSIKYDGDVQNKYSNDINNAKQNYQFYEQNSESPILKGDKGYDEKISSVDDKGKDNIHFTVLGRESRPKVVGNEVKGSESVLKVQDQSGNIYYARPSGKEENGFFDKVYDINNSGIEYIKTGKPQIDKSLQQYDVSKIESSARQDSPGVYNGDNVASIQKDPNGFIVVTFADTKSRQTQYMKILKPEVINGKIEYRQQADDDGSTIFAPNRYMSLKDRDFAIGDYGHFGTQMNKENYTTKQ